MALDQQTRPILERMGTPAAVLDRLTAFEADQRRIQHAQYQPVRERDLIAAAATETASALLQVVRDEVATAAKVRDTELDALERERVAQTEPPRRKPGVETDSDYQARLASTQVVETRRLQAITLATMDAQWIRTATDAAAVGALVEDVLRSEVPEVIARLGRLAEARLAILANEERAKTGSVGGAAFQAHFGVQGRLREWRAAQAKTSIVARKELAVARFEARRADVARVVREAARVGGLEAAFAQAARVAGLE